MQLSNVLWEQQIAQTRPDQVVHSCMSCISNNSALCWEGPVCHPSPFLLIKGCFLLIKDLSTDAVALASGAASAGIAWWTLSAAVILAMICSNM